MGASGCVVRWMGRMPSVLLSACVMCMVAGCNKEDVAPQMHQPGGGWDGPVQEEPAPPEGMEAPMPGEKPEGEPPEPPPPDDEVAPPPSGDDVPLGAPPLPDGVKGVMISGTVKYSSYAEGLIQIDVSDKRMDGAHGRTDRPKIIRLYRLEKPGPFEMEVPEGQGEIWLSAYNDADKNGRPSRGEPRGSAKGNPYKVTTSPVTGIEIELEKEVVPAPPRESP